MTVVELSAMHAVTRCVCHATLCMLHAKVDMRGCRVQDTRLQKKSSLEAAQKEVAQVQKQLADLKADLQRAESTIEVSVHDHCHLCGTAAALPDLSLPYRYVVHQVCLECTISKFTVCSRSF